MYRSTGFSGPGGKIRALLVLAGVALLAHWLDTPPPPLSGAGRVSDGDSFRLGDDRVRLLGLDAPELHQICAAADGSDWSCGAAARDRMADLLARGRADCRPEGHDRYGRFLARCRVNGQDLGATMVVEGLAIAAGDYWTEQTNARDARRGIWAGGFEIPANWRSDHPRPINFLSWLGL
ncbi:MAG: thermonuclease family protein [Devosia sp.]